MADRVATYDQNDRILNNLKVDHDDGGFFEGTDYYNLYMLVGTWTQPSNIKQCPGLWNHYGVCVMKIVSSDNSVSYQIQCVHESSLW